MRRWHPTNALRRLLDCRVVVRVSKRAVELRLGGTQDLACCVFVLVTQVPVDQQSRSC